MQSKRASTDGTRQTRVSLYERVSTERQSEEGHSLADQDARLRGYAASVGLRVTDVFIEAGVSGAKQLRSRPKGSELLEVLGPGDHVIATKLDRMFRSASDALNVVEDFQRRGIHLHLLDIGGDVTGNGVAKLVFTILSGVAEMERQRISERVRSVKEHLRDIGHFTGGKLPRGYRVNGPYLERDPRWTECLEFMRVKRLEEGRTYREIADAVREQFGIVLDYTTVYRIVNGKRKLDTVARNDGRNDALSESQPSGPKERKRFKPIGPPPYKTPNNGRT